MQTKSQNEQIREHLEAGNSITPIEALSMFNCFRLSGRINDLKHEGININSQIVKTESGKRVARYSLQ
ncbi:helix-turn-helix domain-containing protein [uncultured Draconibacterium sp.]|uniref:helix-turn-helix domain-containing protein n=1 Tax=uncultured Draconibacterium sp. TaxID=1573823 RepID=UPI003217CB82